jgi:hypothetical protein
LVKLPSGGLGSTEHDDAGRSLPGFIFGFCVYLVDLPTDCAIEPDFLTLWKDADPDIPILKQAKAEYGKLQ